MSTLDFSLPSKPPAPASSAARVSSTAAPRKASATSAARDDGRDFNALMDRIADAPDQEPERSAATTRRAMTRPYNGTRESDAAPRAKKDAASASASTATDNAAAPTVAPAPHHWNWTLSGRHGKPDDHDAQDAAGGADDGARAAAGAAGASTSAATGAVKTNASATEALLASAMPLAGILPIGNGPTAPPPETSAAPAAPASDAAAVTEIGVVRAEAKTADPNLVMIPVTPQPSAAVMAFVPASLDPTQEAAPTSSTAALAAATSGSTASTAADAPAVAPKVADLPQPATTSDTAATATATTGAPTPADSTVTRPAQAVPAVAQNPARIPGQDPAKQQAVAELTSSIAGIMRTTRTGKPSLADLTTARSATTVPTVAAGADKSAAASPVAVDVAAATPSPRLVDRAITARAADAQPTIAALARQTDAAASGDSGTQTDSQAGDTQTGNAGTATLWSAGRDAALHVDGSAFSLPTVQASVSDGAASAATVVDTRGLGSFSSMGQVSSATSLPDSPLTTLASSTPAAGDVDAQQIIRGMRLQWRGSMGEAQLQLRPEHLGQVTVNVRVDQGTVSATLRAETPAAQQWIQAHQQELRDALQQQGLDVSELIVTTDPDGHPRRDAQSEREASSRPRQPRNQAAAGADQPRFEIRV